ncbi:hypothetical protein KKG31_07590 [Patescibacteria group bacterium]|nr:hypothetical protein [Patescibacteria group bacterium]MBU1758930.1 hypothetical protein [Patescibacteria group bacterium]
MNALLKSTLQLTKNNSFVSIREVQTSPTRALNGFKILLNNGKMQGVYIPQEMLDNYMEDLEAMSSPSYIKLIKEARKETKHIPAKKVWEKL